MALPIRVPRRAALFRHLLCMEGAFFYCNNTVMDIIRLFEKVIESDDIKDIPLIYVFEVVCCVIDVIGSGECFYKTEYE